MQDSTVINVNLINSDQFFYSHLANFSVPTPSHRYTQPPAASEAITNVKLQVESLEILLKELERGYETLKPIPVHIEGSDSNFVASFEAADIHASGDTWFDAAFKLKSLILDIYDSLLSENPTALGPAPKRQLSALLRYVQKANTE